MNKSESILLETINSILEKYLRIIEIHISNDYWNLILESKSNNQIFSAILFKYHNLNFNKFGYINIRINNKCLLDSLKEDKPVFFLGLDISRKKIYYSDLQYLARVYYPLTKQGSCLVKLYSTFDIEKNAVILIANHRLEYNYNWKSLYKRYKTYLNNIKKYTNFKLIDINSKKFKSYYSHTLNIYKTLNVANSKSNFDISLIKSSEVLGVYINLVNVNIDGIKGIFRDEKKYWIKLDLEFYTKLRNIRKIGIIN